MEPTRFALMYFRMVAFEATYHSLSKRIFLFFKSIKDMVQILLMLEVLFIDDSKAEDMFSGAPSGSKPSLLFIAIISSAWG